MGKVVCGFRRVHARRHSSQFLCRLRKVAQSPSDEIVDAFGMAFILLGEFVWLQSADDVRREARSVIGFVEGGDFCRDATVALLVELPVGVLEGHGVV